MLKCKEQVIKYNPNKLYTLAQIVCINHNIELTSLNHIKKQLPNEPIEVIYYGYCTTLSCEVTCMHSHIEKSNHYKFYTKETSWFRKSLVATILPHNEFSINQVDEHRRRAVKRRLNF